MNAPARLAAPHAASEARPYFRYGDPVIAKGERYTFLGYWPDCTLADVKPAQGSKRTFNVSDIKPLAETIVERVAEAFERAGL